MNWNWCTGEIMGLLSASKTTPQVNPVSNGATGASRTLNESISPITS